MSMVDAVYYGALILPLIWLSWLASRPFLVNVNRLLLVISGLLIYGYLQKALVFPIVSVEKAFVAARIELGEPTVSSEVIGHDLVFICYVAIPLFGVLLLMFWLQRVLARCPRETIAQ